MAQQPSHTDIPIDAQGRMVIPSHMRKALGISGSGSLVAKIEKGKLVLEPPEAVWKDIDQMFAQVKPSLSKELLSERRKESKKE
jgi:DNA-binding transcriptional regulator/RsmH inhibitor MraZ